MSPIPYELTAKGRRAALPLEDVVQGQIVDALRRIGCLVFVHRATANGKRSRSVGFGKGWPDLQVIVRGETIYAEVKRGKQDKPRPEQLDVHAMLSGAGAKVFVWRSDADAIRDVMPIIKQRVKR